MDLERRIESFITAIDFRLQSTESEKERALLFSDVRNIVQIIWDNYLNVDIPESFTGCLSGRAISNISEYKSSLFWKTYRSMRETNGMICNLTSFFPSSPRHSPIIRKVFSFNSALDIVEDFFFSYDTDIYNYFLFLRRNKYIYRTNLGTENSYGITLPLSVSDFAFVAIDKFTNDINLLMTIAHEVIHSYIFHLLYNMSYDEEVRRSMNCLDEVYSYFIEFAFADYLEDHHCDKRGLKIIRDNHFNCLISYLGNFKDNFDKFGIVSYDYDILRYMRSETLAYGILLAYHYFNNYLSDRERTKDDILSLSLDSKSYDRHFLLNNYGVKESDLGNPLLIKRNI